MDMVASANLPKPIIESNAFFSITFERDPRFKVGGISPEKGKSTNSELSTRQMKISSLLEKRELSPKEIMEALGEEITDRTLRHDLQALKEQGYVDNEANEGQRGPKTKWFILRTRT